MEAWRVLFHVKCREFSVWIHCSSNIKLILLNKPTFYRCFYPVWQRNEKEYNSSKYLSYCGLTVSLKCLTEALWQTWVVISPPPVTEQNTKNLNTIRNRHNLELYQGGKGWKSWSFTKYCTWIIVHWLGIMMLMTLLGVCPKKEQLVITVISLPPHYSADWRENPTFHCFPIAF